MALLDKFKNKSYDAIPTSTGGGPVNRFFNLENPRSSAIAADTVESQSDVANSVADAQGKVQNMKASNLEATTRRNQLDMESQGIRDRSSNWSMKPTQPSRPAGAPVALPSNSAPMSAPFGIGAGVMSDMKASRAAAATASLAKPMDQLRGEAYGGPGFQGPMPAKTPTPQAPAGFLPPPAFAKPPTDGQQAMDRMGSSIAGIRSEMGVNGPATTSPTAASPAPAKFGEARPLLGNTTFKNLQPRRTGSGNPMDSGGPTQSSYAGLSPFVDEQTAGSPRRISGHRGKRPGARFTEGPMRGKTLDQSLLKSREKYAALSPEQKAAYEAKARMEDISSEIPATGVDPASQPKPLAPTPPAPVSIDPAELGPITPPRRRPGLPAIGSARAGARPPAEDWPD